MAFLRGLGLGLLMFNIFIVNIDNGIESNHKKFADDTKLSGTIDTTEGRAAIQRDLDKLENWAHGSLLRFNKSECKVLKWDQGNPIHEDRLGKELSESSSSGKYLGILVNKKINMSQ